MAGLCTDLITLILIRVPAKSLFRFKSVSKQWCSLISSPSFITLYRRNNNNHHGQPADKRFFFACDWLDSYCFDRRVLDTNLTLTTKFFLPRSVYIQEWVGSCHGLVVLYLANNSYQGDGQFIESSTFIMCNLSTNNYMVLPIPPVVNFSDSEFAPSQFGFGYDSSTDDYKLVVFGHDDKFGSDNDNNNNYEMYYYCQYVYSAKRNSWGTPRRVKTHYMAPLDPAVIDDRIFHWSFRKKLSVHEDRNNNVILGFDICTEEWLKTELPLPDFGADPPERVDDHIQVLDNCLCLVSYDNVKTDVWLMKEYGVKESWTKLVSLPKLGKLSHYPIAYFDNGQLLLYTFQHYERQLVFQHDGDSDYFWYDLMDKSTKPTSVSSTDTRLILCAQSHWSGSSPSYRKGRMTGIFKQEFVKSAMEDGDLKS